MSSEKTNDIDNERVTAEELVSKLSSISDVRQRSYALASRLQALENAMVLDALKAIHKRTLAGDVEYRKLYNGLLISGVLTEVLGQRRMSELVALAQDQGDHEVVSILMDIPDEQSPQDPSQPFLDPYLKEVSLGMRKSLARKPDFKMIDRIARDQDHRVIRNLLQNPRITEKEVVRIAATRPNSPRVLEEIYNHPKWIGRYSVKKAIVMNPYSPPSMALKLLAFMSIQDLEEISQSPHLSSIVRREGRRTVRKKRVPSPEGVNP